MLLINGGLGLFGGNNIADNWIKKRNYCPDKSAPEKIINKISSL